MTTLFDVFHKKIIKYFLLDGCAGFIRIKLIYYHVVKYTIFIKTFICLSIPFVADVSVYCNLSKIINSFTKNYRQHRLFSTRPDQTRIWITEMTFNNSAHLLRISKNLIIYHFGYVINHNAIRHSKQTSS